MKITLPFVCVLLSFYCLIAQPKKKPKDYGIKSKKALELYLKADEQIRYKSFERAQELLLQAVNLEPRFQDALYNLGYAYFMNKNYSQAYDALDKLYQINKDYKLEFHFYYGLTHFHKMQYEQAEFFLSKYLQGKVSPQLADKAKITLAKAKFAKEAIKKPVPFQPKNLGPNINTKGEEYLPSLTADEQILFFTSRREGNMGGYISMMNDYSEDFYYAEKKNGEWQAAVNLGKPINTPENEGAAHFTADGRWVYYTFCSSDPSEGCDIYVAQKVGNYWLNPKNLGPNVNSRYWDSQPCLSNDGKTLYFSSGRPGGQGGADIWFSVWLENEHKWSAPQNIGPPINTPGNEYSPFIHADDRTLYFSSDYLPGFGGFDLFVTRLNEDGSWSIPQNLGYPINTSRDEVNIFVNARGTQGYINSQRDDGFGKNDIYVFDLHPEIRPNLATYVKGRVYDAKTLQNVVAEILFIDLQTGDTVRKSDNDPANGLYLVTLPSNKNYAAIVKKKNYLFFSQNFNLFNLKDNDFFVLDIPLQPIEKEASVILQNVFFDFDKSTLKPESFVELQQLVKLLKENPNLKVEISGHTDNVGNDDYNLKLSQARADEVKNYLVKQGIDENRIIAKGYGKNRPIADNNTEEGKAKNRRTEFKIIDIQ
jgi:outer membrane protein OmpA-like peptidoglycan-associated protein/tetratricopeptide (TPR) repeat protein